MAPRPPLTLLKPEVNDWRTSPFDTGQRLTQDQADSKAVTRSARPRLAWLDSGGTSQNPAPFFGVRPKRAEGGEIYCYLRFCHCGLFGYQPAEDGTSTPRIRTNPLPPGARMSWFRFRLRPGLSADYRSRNKARATAPDRRGSGLPGVFGRGFAISSGGKAT